jgi:hypothetical protein
MRTRILIWTLLGLGMISAVSIVQAEGWFEKHWNGFKRDYQRNNAWPEAFIPVDRARVRQPFAQCIANGYRAQNTLSDYYFDDETGALTEAGKEKLLTILTEMPPQYRTIFVVRSTNPEITAARITSVQQVADRLVTPGEVAQLSETSIRPRTAPAYYIDAIDRAYRETIPAPRLPAAQNRGSTSSMGSSSSGT